MLHYLRDLREHFLSQGLWPEVLGIAGFILAFFLVARLMSEKRAPANTFAWLLIIVLVPWVGVPLYLLLGGRKLRRLAERKTRLLPRLPHGTQNPFPITESPITQTIVSAGGTPPVTGNKIRLLTTGEDAYAVLEHHIRAARTNIHITAFILGRDDTGKRLVKLLAERARAGVKVRLLLDSVGSMFSSRGYVDPLRNVGGRVGRFM